jgi:DNA polymerase
MPVYHPAYLLRTPSAKRQMWDDLKKVMARLASAVRVEDHDVET